MRLGRRFFVAKIFDANNTQKYRFSEINQHAVRILILGISNAKRKTPNLTREFHTAE